MTYDLDSSLTPYVRAALGRKIKNLVLLDVRGLSSVGDFLIICSGRSNRQVSAIADFIQMDLKSKGIRPLSVEGKKEGHWVLLDYDHVILHVFYEPLRDFYDLESLWIDAQRINVDTLFKHDTPQGKQGEPL
jgi:ribosome-associated protein